MKYMNIVLYHVMYLDALSLFGLQELFFKYINIKGMKYVKEPLVLDYFQY